MKCIGRAAGEGAAVRKPKRVWLGKRMFSDHPPAMASPVLSPPPAACLSSSKCTADLIVLFQLEREILRYEAAWLAGVPYWDAKLKIGEHLLEDAQHGEALLKRLHELKAASAEHKQTPGVDELLRSFSATQSGDEWLHGLYGVLKPWFARQLRDYLGH